MTRTELLAVAKPILFNTEMVRAIQNGTKTTTRRVAFPNKDLREFPCKQYPEGWWLKGRVYKNWATLPTCIFRKGMLSQPEITNKRELARAWNRRAE